QKAKARQRLRYYLSKCYLKLNQPQKAKVHLRTYIKEAESGRVKSPPERIVEAKALLKMAMEQSLLRRATPLTSRFRTPPTRPRNRIHPLGIVLLSVGLLSVGGGLLLGVWTQQKTAERDQLYQNSLSIQDMDTQNPPDSRPVQTLHQEAETLAIVANSLYISGGALSVSGILLMITLKAPTDLSKNKMPAHSASPTQTKAIWQERF
ncbi:MAG: hypothetical protein AAGJ35_02285, partial [Myxococcota bacterium]